LTSKDDDVGHEGNSHLYWKQSPIFQLLQKKEERRYKVEVTLHVSTAGNESVCVKKTVLQQKPVVFFFFFLVYVQSEWMRNSFH